MVKEEKGRRDAIMRWGNKREEGRKGTQGNKVQLSQTFLLQIAKHILFAIFINNVVFNTINTKEFVEKRCHNNVDGSKEIWGGEKKGGETTVELTGCVSMMGKTYKYQYL